MPMRKIDLDNFQIATSETAREINRRIILNVLRSHQPISRADLARRSGLQFSTVSLIVEELIDEQWITEGELSNAPRGRKPRVLHFNSERRRILGVDIRPAATTIAAADLNGRFLWQQQIGTNPDPKKFLPELAAAVADLIDDSSFYSGIGVTVPGRVQRSDQRLAYAPNIGWRDVDVKSVLETATSLPVMVECAPNACALAEIWFGSHPENIQDLVTVAVSEGVGAGIFTNGQLLRGPTGMAGEYGHIPLNEDGPLCNCGNQGCWEAYASNTAAVRYYEQQSAKGRGKTRGSAKVGGNGLVFDDVLDLAASGDQAARETLERMGRYLGLGMGMIVTSLAPSVIVVVGEVAKAWDMIGPVIQKAAAERTQMHLPTRIVATDELHHPRLRGAIAVILHSQLGAPLVA